MDTREAIANKIAHPRRESGLTSNVISNISAVLLKRILNGKRKNPSAVTLKKLSNGFEITLGRVFLHT